MSMNIWVARNRYNESGSQSDFLNLTEVTFNLAQAAMRKSGENHNQHFLFFEPD